MFTNLRREIIDTDQNYVYSCRKRGARMNILAREDIGNSFYDRVPLMEMVKMSHILFILQITLVHHHGLCF